MPEQLDTGRSVIFQLKKKKKKKSELRNYLFRLDVLVIRFSEGSGLRVLIYVQYE